LFWEGRKILNQLENADIMVDWTNVASIKEIKKLAGAIVEFDSVEPAFLYSLPSELAWVWFELYCKFGVLPTDDEYDCFGELLSGLPRYHEMLDKLEAKHPNQDEDED
jgi:hypothetical protein